MQNELNGWSDFFFRMRGKKERRREIIGVAVC